MKKLIIFVTLPLMLIVGAGMGAVMFGLIPGFDPLGAKRKHMMGGGDSAPKEEPYVNEAPPPYAAADPNAVVFQLEEFVINLQTERRYPVFMLLSLALELKDPNAQARVAALEPRIRDAVIIYASSLSQEELNGFDGINRIRDGVWVRLRDIIQKEDLLNVQVMKMTIK
ncbi:MAG: flagellar basal body-associated FliL family protein [Nisaea sp.]|uniref:flagellar basal body-associated FliL family protein n=1 Tax=Nisaea sp. TaxID=2024842 RepID=UPI001B1518B6|nr:flagellar basal body-associated FliL family protein [Nisaea sp.]MBO6561118.1 flagellar basal body-associated FliL family protein [Nisaea sp.]